MPMLNLYVPCGHWTVFRLNIMMSNRKERREPWKLPYAIRKHVSYKFRTVERQISKCKLAGDWACVKKLRALLRNAWWGVKRYKK